MNDDPSDLANAYLDDEATLDERARVEGDPALMATVDRLRSVRALLADVEPQAISIREEHLAAALEAWDRIPVAERTGARRDATPTGVDAAAVAAAATVSAPRRLDDRRRTTSTRWIGAAAAALVVVLAGGVALQVGSGSDDDSFDAGSADSVPEAGALLADTAEDSAGADAAERTEAQASELEDAATDATQLDTGIDNAAPPREEGLVVLRTADDLASFASDALDAPESPNVPAATSAPVDDDAATGDGAEPCLGVDVVVGPAVYGDVVVVVGIDESRNLAIAYVVATCNEIARARLP